MTMDLLEAHKKAVEAGAMVAQARIDQFYNGQDAGACGFAWVTYYPVHKGNTRAGKAERQLMESAGFRQDWTGKNWQLWNPSGYGGQNVDAKYVGAVAYAKVLMELVGIKVYAGERLD